MRSHTGLSAHVLAGAAALVLVASCKEVPREAHAPTAKPLVKAAPAEEPTPAEETTPAETTPAETTPAPEQPPVEAAPTAKAAPAPAKKKRPPARVTATARETSPAPAPAPVKAAPPRPTGTAAYNAILKQYCRAGRVDYAGIHGNARQQLNDYVKHVGSRGLPGSRDAKLAFYINAYNAITIKMIVDRWPAIKSVMAVPGFFKARRNKVAGRMLTLDKLENAVIRPTFKDARIHFALVCGARSCPPLRCAAFTGGGLQRTLEGLTRRFINSRLGVRLDGDRVRISKLFEWYGSDFVAAGGSVGKYLARYHKSAADRLPTAKIEFQPYSWALNKK